MSKFDRFLKYAVTLAAALLMIGAAAVINSRRIKEEKHIKVGYIYVADASNPYTCNFIKAQKLIEETYGDQVESVIEYNVTEGNEGPAVERLISAGCELIFGTSYGYGSSLKEAAAVHPEIQFCAATSDNAENPVVPNYHTFMGRIYEGRYISGCVAGMKIKELTENGTISGKDVKIGYVGAFPYAEVISGYTAFYLGVKSVVPDVTMKVRYTYSWSDYAAEKRIAKELIEENCIIISQHSDTMGPAVACEEAIGSRLVHHVGYNQSMLDIAPRTSLTGCRINWAPYMLSAAGAVLEDKDIESVQQAVQYEQDACAGFDYDWVEMLEMNEVLVNEEMRNEIDRYIREFIESPHTVFTGEYKGVNPYNENDVIDLADSYEENEFQSAPSFCYVLDGIETE